MHVTLQYNEDNSLPELKSSKHYENNKNINK